MSLRELAAKHLSEILGNTAQGFARPVCIKNPDGQEAHLTGFTTDISQLIDPETGVAVSGRSASVTVALEALRGAFAELPKNQPERGRKPWAVTFTDIGGQPYTFKVSSTMPDRALGALVCTLEALE